jgi:hypothetical protein
MDTKLFADLLKGDWRSFYSGKDLGAKTSGMLGAGAEWGVHRFSQFHFYIAPKVNVISGPLAFLPMLSHWKRKGISEPAQCGGGDEGGVLGKGLCPE